MVHNSVTWPRRDFTLSSTHFYCIYIVNLHITHLLDLGCINSFREHFTLISFKIVRTFTFVFENECFCNTSPFNHNIFNSFAKFGTFPILHNFRKRRIYWGSSCEVREVTNSRKEIVRTWPLRFVGMMIMMIWRQYDHTTTMAKFSDALASLALMTVMTGWLTRLQKLCPKLNKGGNSTLGSDDGDSHSI